ncbi:tRNA uridine-5-carboxymethylaminomethyl(34) synthesis GTPase MnmE [Candidatus Blochmannia ocreatus (nom. nud.)]|uniref:tRNA modification GTPase MnmE n=1 Tax=Candidatus Blochmannia ocreatus (nom. nud.) TaxID=251538 RepID=A0ABY4STA1_9ENTR|nr:tRNA uridine-5-carboxymethylaminomethyl(34) synthesis GTPase MnmE [Candidatus Blochmannia ocreatus]URJ25106.1 tRNA uridine-5-carboxymethylaminomethyl(34) synthesis GTPase MnmE [Candidatus Blochmannia ocreatus]
MLNNKFIHSSTDTITAISTPIGIGGIGVIRVSGPLVPIIIPELLHKKNLIPRKAEYLPIFDTDGTILEQVIALFFPEPNSFTGENTLEIHGHSGLIILDILLERILKTSPNIRIAQPGEFTKRAFINGKIDLVQAEAITDIINANSYQAAKSASNYLQGHFSQQIRAILNKLTELRIYIESSIDFSEEVHVLSYDKTIKLLDNIIYDIKKMHQSACHNLILREGLKIVIAGEPNVGKSSLFNALIGTERAIVNDASGTTRDILHECIQLNGILFHIIDTAGFQNNINNEVEKIGIQRAIKELNNADHILWVINAYEDRQYSNKKYEDIFNNIRKKLLHKNQQIPITIIRNKSDLSKEKNKLYTIKNHTFITLSALFNSGIDLLKNYLINNITYKSYKDLPPGFINNQSNLITRRRHLNILEKSFKYLLSAKNQLISTQYVNEFFAEDIKLAHNELIKIFGKFTTEDLLKKIFSTFCIGK